MMTAVIEMKLPYLQRLCLLGALLLFSFALPACTHNDKQKSIEHLGEDTSADTETEPEIPCTIDSDLFTDIIAEPTTIETVIRVRWTSAKDQPGWVRFQNSVGRSTNTPADSAIFQHEAILVGNRPLSTVNFQVISQDESLWCSEVLTVETGGLPSTIPEINLSHPTTGVDAGGYITVSIMTPEAQFPVILDSEGEIVWAVDLDVLGIVSGGSPMFGASLSLDRQAILFNFHSALFNSGAIHRVSLDGELVETVELPNTKIDFVELPDGGYATLGTSWYSFANGEKLFRGDLLLEVTPQGDITELWNGFESIPHNLGAGERLGVEAEVDAQFEDWSHANAIVYDPQSNDYFLSIQTLSSIVRIDRDTGEQIWQLSAQGGDFDHPDSDPPILEFPHAMHFLGDSLLVFNRSNLGFNDCAFVTLIDIDEQSMNANLSWSYVSSPCLLVTFLGDVQKLENGNTLVVWSSSGQIDELTPQGNSVWRLNVGLGAGFGFAEHTRSLY